MKKTVLLLATVAYLSGCASTPDQESAATMDRDEAIIALSADMEELGFNRVNIQPGVDEFLHVAASVLERQHGVMQDYRVQAENHADVQAFLYAYHGATPEELQQAALDFDQAALSEEEKIGPKLAAYRAASASVSEKNTQLAVEITAELIKAGIILSQYSTEVAKSSTIGLAAGFLSGNEQTADNNLGLALLRAKKQLELASEANKVIKLEQETMDAVDALQAELEAKG